MVCSMCESHLGNWEGQWGLCSTTDKAPLHPAWSVHESTASCPGSPCKASSHQDSSRHQGAHSSEGQRCTVACVCSPCPQLPGKSGLAVGLGGQEVCAVVAGKWRGEKELLQGQRQQSTNGRDPCAFLCILVALGPSAVEGGLVLAPYLQHRCHMSPGERHEVHAALCHCSCMLLRPGSPSATGSWAGDGLQH